MKPHKGPKSALESTQGAAVGLPYHQEEELGPLAFTLEPLDFGLEPLDFGLEPLLSLDTESLALPNLPSIKKTRARTCDEIRAGC